MDIEAKEAIRAKARAAEEEITREAELSQDEAAENLRARLRLSSSPLGADSSTPAGSSAQPKKEKPPEVLPEADGLLEALSPTEREELTAKLDDDPAYGDAIAEVLIARNLMDRAKPSWYKADGIFDATIDMGGGNIVKITATSFGSKAGGLKSEGGAAQLHRKLLGIQKQLAAFEDKTDDDSIAKADEIILKQNEVVSRLVKLQAIQVLAPSIKSWKGPVFSDAEGKPLPLLRGFRMNFSEDEKDALEVMEVIPEKAVQMIKQGVELLANEGIETVWRRGNSRGR